MQVLGVHIYEYNIRKITNEIIHHIKDNPKTNRLISATGAHGIIHAQRIPGFKKLLDSFYLNLPDGMPAVWVGRMKGAREMQRCYGPDFFEYLIRVSAGANIKHFFCGGKEGVATELKTVSERKFFNFNVVGVFCPPFRYMNDVEMEALGSQINNSGADIVWIGLGTPRQEEFASRLSSYSNVHYIITVGAAFDFHTGKLKQAPNWMQNAGLEWLFRLMIEPKRLYKRYLTIVPLFIFYNVKEFLGIKKYR
ncbi:MAG: glycosyltransferase [Chitinophagaceae bacterium]|nr:glycosyltransferase [Chitinophagaceae bacterium]